MLRARGVIQTIVDQHAEEAAFLWLLRDQAVDAPHYDSEDLARLDERVEAHLDGLRVAGPAGFALAKLNFESQRERGEAFAACALALESRDLTVIGELLDLAYVDAETRRGAVGALAWLDPAKLNGLVQPMLSSQRCYYGLAACSVHRVDPGRQLVDVFDHDDALVRARAYRLAGEVGRADLLASLDHRAATGETDRDALLFLHQSAVLLGDRGDHLEALGSAVSAGDWRGLRALIPALGHAGAKRWISACSDERMRIVATGLLGDPEVVPWLIKLMADDDLARLAGEAFALITGVDLAYDDLDRDQPEGFEAGPTEDPSDEKVAMDEDEDLPWPDPERIGKWWAGNGRRFPVGERYLLGLSLDASACRTALKQGFQRQKRSATHVLAALETASGVKNWRVR